MRFFFVCLSFFYLLVGSLCFKLLKLNTDKLQTCGAETKTKTLLNPDAHQAVMWASIWLLSLMIGGGFLGWARRLGRGDPRKQRHVSTARLRRPIRSLPNKEDEPKKKLSRLHVNTENGVSEYLHIEAPSAVTWNVRVRVNGTWLLVKKVSHEEKKSFKVSKTLSDLFFISDLCRPSFLLIFFPSRLQISKQKIPCL